MTWYEALKQFPKSRKIMTNVETLQVKKQDVWIVNNWEAIQWMQNPTPQSQMDTFLPWNTCEDPIAPEDQACNIPR